MALGNRGVTVEAAQQCTKDSKHWRALVHMYAPVFYQTTLLCSDGYHLERGGMLLHDADGVN